MKYMIRCTHKKYAFESEVNSFDFEDCEEIYIDIFNDEILSVISENSEVETCLGLFYELDLVYELIYAKARSILQDEFAGIVIEKLTFDNHNKEISCSKVSAYSIISDMIDERENTEQSYCDAGPVIINMLTNFLNQGIWQYGFKKKDGSLITDIKQWPKPVIENGSTCWYLDDEQLHPIIWFGLLNEKPFECWSLNTLPEMFEQKNISVYSRDGDKTPLVEKWKIFWFYPYFCLDWDVLIPGDISNCYTTWMFAELGLEEPEDEFLAVMESCPIILDKADTPEMFTSKINDFFRKKYQELSF